MGECVLPIHDFSRTSAHYVHWHSHDKKPSQRNGQSKLIYQLNKPAYPTRQTKSFASHMDLLVDGNLAHMFGPEGAAIYFARLLKVDVRTLRPTMSPEWPHAFFITSPQAPTAVTMQQNNNNAAPPLPPTLYINGLPAYLLDYTIRQVGTVVPQGIWPPGNTSSASSSTRAPALNLNMPIFFVGMDRISLGLPLPLAIAEGDHVSLQGASSPAQIGHGSTTYIRITVSILRAFLLVSSYLSNYLTRARAALP